MGTSTRSVALAQREMTSSPHDLSSTAGSGVLQDDGRAVDAAETDAALGMINPLMTGDGDDAALWSINDTGAGRVHALNGGYRAGAGATRGGSASRHTSRYRCAVAT